MNSPFVEPPSHHAGNQNKQTIFCEIQKFFSCISAQLNTVVKYKQINHVNLNSQITLHHINSRLDGENNLSKKLNLIDKSDNVYYKQHIDISKLSSNNYSFNSNNNQSFLVLHVNIRSIQKNLNKLEELLVTINIKPDLIALSETWHNTIIATPYIFHLCQIMNLYRLTFLVIELEVWPFLLKMIVTF